MINFKEELSKFEPILEIDDIEGTIHKNELQDMFDMLSHISTRGASGGDFSDIQTDSDYNYKDKE